MVANSNEVSPMIQELELRGPLSKEEHQRLLRELNSRGHHLGDYDRILLDLTSEGISGRRLDVRVRVSNGNAELVAKFGEWAGPSRQEVTVNLPQGQFEKGVEFLGLLGYKTGILCHRFIRRFSFGAAEFQLQEVIAIRSLLPQLEEERGYSYFFEIERMVDEADVKLASKQLAELAAQLGLRLFPKEKFYAYVEDLNENANFKWNFGEHFQALSTFNTAHGDYAG